MDTNNLAGIIRRHGAGQPDKVVLHYEGRAITFGDLDLRSSQVAQALLAEGVGAQDHVALIDKNGPEFFELLFGCAKINAVNVAVNWRLAPPEMAAIVNDAEAKVLVVGQDFLPHLEKFGADLRTVGRILVIGDHPEHEAFASWVDRMPTDDPGAEPRPGDVAIQLYTSGTTGLPKGVMLTNDNTFTLLPEAVRQWEFDEHSVNLVAMPLFHIAGSGWALVGIEAGGESVLLREVDPARILEVLPRFGITNALLVPAVLQFLLMSPGVDQVDFSALRAIVYGASPITDEVLTRAMATFGCHFVQAYGLTETHGSIIQLDAADHDPVNRPDLLRSCGRPYPWVELKIVDPETGDEVATGQVGELWTRSGQNMKGYWNKPEETAATIVHGGWLRTGDAGYVDEDGYVFLYDRVKDMIVSGGENTYPAEVENVLMSHPDVADVAVIGVPHERWGETVKAIVVPAAGAPPDAADLVAFCRERLAHFKCPTSVDFAAELPRNPSGKLLKRELRDPYWEGHTRRIS